MILAAIPRSIARSPAAAIAGVLLALAVAVSPGGAASGAQAGCAAAAAPAARRIAFDEAVGIALDGNTTLARARNATARDRVAVSQARMAFLPDLRLGVSGSESYTRSPEAADSAETSRWHGSAGATLSSSVVLFNGFANAAELRAARRQAEAGELDMERTRQTVVIDVITGYLGLIAATEQERVRRENRIAQEEQERLVSALVDAGEKPISDLYQQQANVASARLALVEAERSLQLSRLDLVQALQLDPQGEYVFEIPALPETLPGVQPLDARQLIVRAFEQRPDLAALERNRQAARENERVARAGRLPRVSLSADYGTRIAEGGGDFGEQFNDRQSGSVGLSLSLPLFDRQATSADIQRTGIATDEAQLAVADLRQQVALQVRQALLDWNAAEEQLQAAEAQVRAAQQALDAVRERYEVGAATLYEVTLARADVVSATSTRVNARYNLLWQGRLLDYYVGDLDPALGLLGGRG